MTAPLLFDLAVLYRALAFKADADLDPAEEAAMRSMLAAWAPGEDPARIDHVLREAALADVGAVALAAVLERVAVALDESGRGRVLADLRALAEADGRVTGGERDVIALVEGALGP